MYQGAVKSRVADGCGSVGLKDAQQGTRDILSWVLSPLSLYRDAVTSRTCAFTRRWKERSREPAVEIVRRTGDVDTS